jgi:hypothetical protein
MKVAYYAESPADEAALAIITEGILRQQTETVSHVGYRSRGWNSVVSVLPVVLRQLHYHSDAQGLVLVLDSNGSQPHLPEHELPQARDPKCRLCKLRGIVDDVVAKLRPRTYLPPLKIAIGLAVPTIEAWLLCGEDSHVTEAAWINGLKESRSRMPYTKGDLKRRLYGTTHPSLAIETEKMKAAATRLCGNLAAIESLFPDGFGALLKSLRSW